MKKLATAAVVVLLSIGATAQDNKMQDSKMQSNQSSMKKDHVMMKDGKMMTMMSGKSMIMDKDMTLKNGTMIMMDGTVKMKDGKTMKMKEGESMDMDGKMMMHDKMSK